MTTETIAQREECQDTSGEVCHILSDVHFALTGLSSYSSDDVNTTFRSRKSSPTGPFLKSKEVF